MMLSFNSVPSTLPMNCRPPIRLAPTIETRYESLRIFSLITHVVTFLIDWIGHVEILNELIAQSGGVIGGGKDARIGA